MQQKRVQPDAIAYIMKSEIGVALAKGFTQLYKNKPQFPVTYLGKWLKSYSTLQLNKQKLLSSQAQKEQKYQRLQSKKRQAEEQTKKVFISLICQKKDQVGTQQTKVQNQYRQGVIGMDYLGDLLVEWLPEHLEKAYQLAGCYIGKVRHPRKQLQLHNFEPGAQYDIETPKIIQYIGASRTQKDLMLRKILSAETGKSFDVFNVPEEEPAEGQGEEGEKKNQKPPRKNYIYIPDVLKEEKMFYFKYPQLGSYACYPIKYKHLLLEPSFEKGIIDYKEYLRAKDELEKEYNQKLTELRTEMEDTKKKYEDFEGTEEEASLAQKQILQETFNKAATLYQEEASNPPKAPQVVFDSVEQCYIVGCDTMGQDRKLSQQTLDKIDSKVSFFRNQWEKRQRQMLFQDITTFIEEEPGLESAANQHIQIEKGIVATLEPTIRQQFPDNQKKQQFELSAAKCEKLIPFLYDQVYSKSRRVYLRYAVPKYKQILQIGLMLVGYSKQDINLGQSNTLNWRKVREDNFIDQFLERLKDYQLRREESAEAISPQYKVNKLLQRRKLLSNLVDKLDLQQVSHYNTWLWLLANVLKSMCWARIQCRDACIDDHERRTKAKEQCQVQITKYEQEIEKAISAHKAELQEGARQSFNEQQWRKNYHIENKKPQRHEVQEFKPHLDIE